ncbi:MAG: hypothetical protein ACR2P0_13240, partial [Acidimicrobiales bacterium]
RQHRSYRSTMRNLTIAYSIYQLVSVGFEIWLLANSASGTVFLVIRTLVGTASGFFGFMIAVFYADRKLRGIPGFPGVMHQFEQIGIALEEGRAARR